MVATVRIEVAADALVTLNAGAKQVSPAGEPLTAQAMFTCPVKPPDGVTVSVLVPLLPSVTVMPPPLVSPNAGATALTVIETDCVAVT